MADKSGARVRAAAAEIVDAVVSSGRSLDAAIADGERQLPESDRPLLRLLCFGTIRFHWRLRAQLERLLERPLKRKDNVIQSLLTIGIYQLTDTRIPNHAAVSMTVDATKFLRRPKFAPLVNAVLRNFLRKNIAQTAPQNDEEQYNHPSWMIRQLQADWPDHWQEILSANNQRAAMWLRVNARCASPGEFLENTPGLDAAAVPGFDQALRMHKPVSVTALPGFAEGRVSVQDGAAQLAAGWLTDRDNGGRILDACAAPGGKTAHLLELVPEAQVSAVDIDAGRLATLRENLQRFGLDATLIRGDASKPQDWWDGQTFDKILLDAPCSASGVIRRHPDIKLLRRASDLAGLVRLQDQMLTALWPLLSLSGRLLYVTCSVFRQENDGVIQRFLQQQADANAIDLLPNNNIRDLMYRSDFGYQILPGTEGLDGFYFACLERKSKQSA